MTAPTLREVWLTFHQRKIDELTNALPWSDPEEQERLLEQIRSHQRAMESLREPSGNTG